MTNAIYTIILTTAQSFPFTSIQSFTHLNNSGMKMCLSLSMILNYNVAQKCSGLTCRIKVIVNLQNPGRRDTP